jgi:hypothetical protein
MAGRWGYMSRGALLAAPVVSLLSLTQPHTLVVWSHLPTSFLLKSPLRWALSYGSCRTTSAFR